MTTKPSPFDLTHIKIQWGDPIDEIYRIILRIFVDEAKTLYADARSALIDDRRNDIARACHTLGGASANVGALYLARCAGAVEDAAGTEEKQLLESLLNDVENALRGVLAQVEIGGPEQHV